MFFELLYWSGIYIGAGTFLNIVVSNVYKNELIAFTEDYYIKNSVSTGKMSKEEFDRSIAAIKNNFFGFSCMFSLFGSFGFPFILIPALFGKNPFSTENS